MLTKDELAFFEENGYLTGLRVCSGEEMSVTKTKIESALASNGYTRLPTGHRHLDNRAVYDLCSHRNIVERIAEILGPNLLLWHSRFFDKAENSGAVPWHQDAPFWPIKPDTCVSAWIAIDRADAGNNCVEVVPGSHKTPIPHIRSEGKTGRFGVMAEPAYVDESKLVKIELEPGEFFIFDRWLLHGSRENLSGKRRMGLSARFVPTNVRIDIEKMAPRFPELGFQVVRGEDTFGHNLIVAAPV